MDTYILFYIACTVMFIILFGCLYLVERKKYILLWTLFWVYILIVYILDYLMLLYGHTTTLNIIEFTLFVYAFWTMFNATLMFIGKKPLKIWRYPFIFLILFCIGCNILNIPSLYYRVPGDIFCGILLCYIGFISIRIVYIKSVIRYILGSFLITLGICISLNTCFVFFSPVLQVILQIVTSISSFGSSINLQAAYYQSMRETQETMNEQIRQLIIKDKLTNIYNRGFFEIQLKEMDIEENLPISIIIGDLNGLKLINDIFGHQKGDELLVNAAKIMKEYENDGFVARWGGDEFIMFLPLTNHDEAVNIVKNIKKSCNDFKSDFFPLDISLGIDTKVLTTQSMFEIIKTADEHLYKNKLKESKIFRNSIIQFLKVMISEKDFETEAHVMRMKDNVKKIANRLNMSSKEVDELVLLAYLHDIGKITIPDEIIKKQGALTPKEWEVMQKHSEAGYRISSSSDELTHISEAVLCHHERWDGKGYPQGLLGEDIPIFSRIISIVDSYDAMTNDRPYKLAINKKDALLEIKRCAGSEFDPHIAEIFINIMNEG